MDFLGHTVSLSENERGGMAVFYYPFHVFLKKSSSHFAVLGTSCLYNDCVLGVVRSVFHLFIHLFIVPYPTRKNGK
jgi:hypothetical protein